MKRIQKIQTPDNQKATTLEETSVNHNSVNGSITLEELDAIENDIRDREDFIQKTRATLAETPENNDKSETKELQQQLDNLLAVQTQLKKRLTQKREGLLHPTRKPQPMEPAESIEDIFPKITPAERLVWLEEMLQSTRQMLEKEEAEATSGLESLGDDEPDNPLEEVLQDMEEWAEELRAEINATDSKS